MLGGFQVLGVSETYSCVQKSIHSEQGEAFKKLLREVRLEAGLTQEKLAEKLKTTQSRITDYESGNRRLDLMELEQICLAIGIPLETFVARYLTIRPPLKPHS